MAATPRNVLIANGQELIGALSWPQVRDVLPTIVCI